MRKAIRLVEQSSFKNANPILKKTKEYFSEAKEYENVVVCTLLLSECALNQMNKNDFSNKYREARETAKLHNIDYGGVISANI